MTANTLVRHQLDAVDWDALRIIQAHPASDVPDALEDLLAATTEAAAESAYWKLDNRVVVQGQLFDSAPPLVPALFAAVAGPLPEVVTPYVLDLLVEILSGESDQSEVARGRGALGSEARRAAREGIWLAYRLASDPAAPVRERAVLIVHAIDPDRARVARLLAAASADPNHRVRGFAAELADSDDPQL